MKFFRLTTLFPSLIILAALLEPLHAAPALLAPPAISPQHLDVQAVCHHYRWSSQRACTSTKTLRFVARPPLYYPSRYFGGRPHYYYEQQNFYWRSLYDRNRWLYGPFGYGWPYRYYGY